MNPTKLAEVWRGNTVESVHCGHIVAVNGDGETICALGDAEILTFMRSAAKPFQSMPLVTTGAADRFGFLEKELALACASHSGEPIHAATAARMLEKIGLSESDLHCGAQEPYNVEIARMMIRQGTAPTQLHNNCSGKHAGLLASAIQINAPIETYEKLENPLQQLILENISRFSDVRADQIRIGTDGCGAPNFALPLNAIALMFARMVLPPASFDDETREACRRLITAMKRFPEMVGGELMPRLDTEIMRASNGAIISKIGADGVYCAAVLPSPEWKRGLGIALKIADGEERRARPVIALEIFRQLGIFDARRHESLAPYVNVEILSRRFEKVGQVVPAFDLKR